MGVRRALRYQCLLAIPLVGIWLFTTSVLSAGYSPLPLLSKPGQIAEFPFAKRLTISLTLLYDGQEVQETAGLEGNLSGFIGRLSHYMEARLYLQSAFIDKVCCDNCQGKMDTFSPYFSPLNLESNRDHLRIFAIITNKECEPLPLQHVVYVKKQGVGSIAAYVAEITRKHLRLANPAGTDLINGFTSEELHTLPQVLGKKMLAWVSSRTELFNTLMNSNSPTISQAVSKQIEHVRSLLQPEADYEKLLEAAYQLDLLLAEPSLAREEYFQPDFKIGVYAPLLVPPVFPLVGVAYSVWTRRRRS